MAEHVIYVSGNPELYPLEYYDETDGRFEGAFPEILEAFAEESGYDVIYYENNGKDNRERHFENIQVDVISGVGEEYRPEGETVTVFEARQDGGKVSYGITFTEAAPENFRKELTEYLRGLSESEKTGILMTAAREGREDRPVSRGLLGLIAALLAAVCVLAALLYRYHRRTRRTERRLEQDDATGLGNRDYLEKYYAQFISDRNRVMYCMYYFYIDTERLGRLTGRKETEEAMRYAGAVLNGYAGEQDILARISEDGFVLLKLTGEGRQSKEWLHSVIGRIRAYSEEYRTACAISAYAGVYPLGQSDRNLDDMILNARQGAYLASREGADYRLCSEEALARFREQRMMEGDLERAFANREFQMYVQFYVETRSGRISGAEALTKWRHPAKGVLTPAAFIPILEKAGAISRLDYLMLEYACAFLERNPGREGGFFLSCNFSRTSFTSPDFVGQCRTVIEKYTFDRSRLIFELTESPEPGDAEQIKKNAEQMKEYGIGLALDDFGEGYTCFKDLLDYPIDIVKLDKSLTDRITEEKGGKLLRALIGAWHEISVKCLAEGVEEQASLEALKELSCDAVQGYMFYYPLPEPEAEAILKEMDRNDKRQE